MKQEEKKVYKYIIEIIEKISDLKKFYWRRRKREYYYQYMIISEKTFENEPRQVTPPLYLDFSELPKINLKILSNAIHHSGFLCEVDNLHPTFILEVTGKNYVEGHHLIPLSKQKDFSNSLDTESNIVVLCTVYHKIFHHGKKEIKEKLIELIYNKRKLRLENSGIGIELEKLKKYYK